MNLWSTSSSNVPLDVVVIVERAVIKFGGALITEKQSRKVFRPDTVSAIAPTILSLVDSGMRLIIVHGAGSYGHIDAKSGNLSRGLVHGREGEQRRLKRIVRDSMSELNNLVVSILEDHGVRCRTHPPRDWVIGTGPEFKGDINRFEEEGFVHITFGDVVDVDDDREFGILSGDHLVERLSTELPHVQKVVFLLDGLEGLHNMDPSNAGSRVIPVWTESTSFETSINESTDVTGGMALKVEVASRISQSVPLVGFVNGLKPDNLQDLLFGKEFVGTIFGKAKSDE